MTIDIDEAKVERNEFGLWLGWTLATAGGMLIGFLPSIFLVNVLNLGLAQIVVPALAGTLVGIAQWVALRRFLTAHSDWILASGTSWAVGYVVGLFLIQNMSTTVLGASGTGQPAPGSDRVCASVGRDRLAHGDDRRDGPDASGAHHPVGV